MPLPTEERRLVTILFADLSGFTALARTLEPEDVREAVNVCFEHLNKVIVHRDGMIHKYEGDLVIALFGLPTTHEDDPERAVRAALEMLDLMPEINQALGKRLKIAADLGLHIGINSGTVVAGEIGSAEKREYTIMGDAVNLASRLKDVAQRSEAVVSEAIFRTSRYLFDYEARPPVSIKGIGVPVRVFRPLGVKSKPEPKRGIRGLHSPMVGRDDEFQRLRCAIERLRQGQGGMSFVSGGAGLGKSRLLEELKKSIAGESARVGIMEGRCLPYGEAIAYWPFLQMLETQFGISENDSVKECQAKLTRKAREVFPDGWEELVPYLGYLFSVRFTGPLDEKVKYLDANGLRVQLILAIKRLLIALAGQQPILLAIDDCQWIDNESLALLEVVFSPAGEEATRPGSPILFIGLSRIEKESAFHKAKERLRKKLGRCAEEITLQPFEERVSNQLFYNLLSVPGVTEAFKNKIIKRAEGNPFYLEEIVRSLIDSGLLYYEEGVWHFRPAPTAKTSKGGSQLDPEIPDTVQAVIASRLDRLEPEVRDILQLASIIGRSFYAPILEGLGHIDSLMLTLHLATLEDFDFIVERRKVPEAEYVFRHTLLQEVTYNGLLKSRRRELHGRVGELVEHLYRDRLDEFTELLAYQYANSSNTDKAIEWLRRAGQKAKERYANEEAISFFIKLVGLLQEAPGGPRQELYATYEALGDIYVLQARYDPAREAFDAMLGCAAHDKVMTARAQRKLALISYDLNKYRDCLGFIDRIEPGLGDEVANEAAEKIELLLLRVEALRHSGELQNSVAVGEQALAAIEDLARRQNEGRVRSTVDRSALSRMKGDAYKGLAGSYFGIGEYDKAIDLLNRSLVIAEELDDKLGVGKALGFLGIARCYQGEYDKAIELDNAYLKISEEIGYRRGVNLACNYLGLAYCGKGEFEKGIECYQKSIRVAEEIGDKEGIGSPSINLGNMYAQRGDHKKALEFYERARQVYSEIGSLHGIASTAGNLGVTYGDMAEFAKALDHYQQAYEIFSQVGDMYAVATCLGNLGHINQALGAYEKAERLYREEMKTFKDSSNWLGVGSSLRHLGDLFLEMDRLPEARSHLLEAAKILEPIGDQAELVEVYVDLADLEIREMRAGRQPGRAMEHLERAMNACRSHRVVAKEALCHSLYGQFYTVTGDFGKGDENFQKAIAILDNIEARDFLADTFFHYANLLKQTGRSDQARAHYVKAARLYQELHQGHKVPRVNRALAELEPPA